MLELVHRSGSRLRNSKRLREQKWLWNRIEPAWNRVFALGSTKRGFATHIGPDVFRLEYEIGSRYDRQDQRAYEPRVYSTFTGMIREGMQVLDIGAHVGILTLAAAKRVGPSGNVYAFEPSPDTFKTLQHHLLMNGYRDRAEAIQAVVSDTDGQASFYTYGQSMAASLSKENVEVLNPELRSHAATRVDSPSVTLDRFCRDRAIVPDVIKIDVEGAEVRVLEGSRGILSAGRTAILCEVHPQQMKNCGSTLSDMETFLDDVGYKLEPIEEPNAAGIFHALIVPRAQAGSLASDRASGPR